MILYHYTDQQGLAGILASGVLLASTAARNPQDVRYGDGQNLSDVIPGSKSLAQLSRLFLGNPFQARRFTHYVAIEAGGLNFTQGRTGVYVVPGTRPLDLADRIVQSGQVILP